jgi:hypothetical protein
MKLCENIFFKLISWGGGIFVPGIRRRMVRLAQAALLVEDALYTWISRGILV